MYLWVISMVIKLKAKTFKKLHTHVISWVYVFPFSRGSATEITSVHTERKLSSSLYEATITLIKSSKGSTKNSLRFEY